MIDPGTNEKGEEYMAYNERRWYPNNLFLVYPFLSNLSK